MGVGGCGWDSDRGCGGGVVKAARSDECSGGGDAGMTHPLPKRHRAAGPAARCFVMDAMDHTDGGSPPRASSTPRTVVATTPPAEVRCSVLFPHLGEGSWEVKPMRERVRLVVCRWPPRRPRLKTTWWRTHAQRSRGCRRTMRMKTTARRQPACWCCSGRGGTACGRRVQSTSHSAH
jgi:hypothetical protein